MTILIGTKSPDVITGTGSDDYFDGYESSDIYLIGLDSGYDLFADTGTEDWDRILAVVEDAVIGLAWGFGLQSGIEEISAGGYRGVCISGGSKADDLDFTETQLTGIDRITGRGGDDRITGSAGKDNIRGNNGDDLLAGGSGNDRLFGGAANDLVPLLDAAHGFDGNDSLYGGSGTDELVGGADDDMLYGGNGADLLHGGTGFDLLTGGAGSDRFCFASTLQAGNLITDFAGELDLIDLSAVDADSGTSFVNEAFRWGGRSDVRANAVTASAQFGNTVLSMDVDGDAVADMTLTLFGLVTLRADDFVL